MFHFNENIFEDLLIKLDVMLYRKNFMWNLTDTIKLKSSGGHTTLEGRIYTDIFLFNAFLYTYWESHKNYMLSQIYFLCILMLTKILKVNICCI